MRRRWARMMLAALAMLAVPVADLEAQTQLPAQAPEAWSRFTPSDGPERARTDTSPALRAREAEAAAAAATRCDAGEAAGCAALGRAYLHGEGRPQSRPVAEILLREACARGAGEACGSLGYFLVDTRRPDLAPEGAALLRRGCDLGALDACADLADRLAQGFEPDYRPDPAAATALREATCAKGGAAACATIFAARLAAAASAAEEDEALGALGRLCREGTAPACRTLVTRLVREDTPRKVPYIAALLGDACRAGLAEACADLARSAFRAGEGPPESRAAALELFDRACDLARHECRAAADIRARPALAVPCAGGDQAACTGLADLLAVGSSPLADEGEALRLLAAACEAGHIPACGRAASVLRGMQPRPLPPQDAARVLGWLGRACEAGEALQCENLGELLVRGEDVPQDRARGFAFVSLACEGGRTYACDALEEAAETDPEAPLPTADSRLLPPMDAAEEAALYARAEEERRAENERNRTTDCTTTTVEFRGQAFTDTICEKIQRVTGAFIARIGEAPWQALLWRPARLGDFPLTRAQQVLCGGAVVRTGWVLTAAHCLTDEITIAPGRKQYFPVNATSGHRIRLGLANPLADEGITYPILKVLKPKQFSRAGFAFDIALVQYDPKAGRRGAVVRPVAQIRLDPQPLGTRRIVPRAPAYVYGWGSTAYEGGSLPPDALRGARLLLRGEEDCMEVTRLGGLRAGSVLCAAGARGEQACFGDSGGPLVSFDDASGVPTVIGVVSAGIKCGTTGKPSRFTRLGHPVVRSWLASHVPGYVVGRVPR
ncbi:trypsin-like serine protease [Erythrobacter sp. NE805]|uniref:trypsin-like serine protease n=1 Tax=Erythrobacter sp. NE805 TaxID=3389875 RepID=UPI00396B2CC7